MAKDPMTDQTRIESLEKRVAELESRLNALTRPNPEETMHHIKQVKRSQMMQAAALKSVKELLSDGVKRKESQIRKTVPNISKRMFKRICPVLKNDGKYYFLEVKKDAETKQTKKQTTPHAAD